MTMNEKEDISSRTNANTVLKNIKQFKKKKDFHVLDK